MEIGCTKVKILKAPLTEGGIFVTRISWSLPNTLSQPVRKQIIEISLMNAPHVTFLFFYLSECGSEMNEDTKPSVLPYFPQDMFSPRISSNSEACPVNPTSDSVKMSEPLNVGLQLNVAPMVIEPQTNDSAAGKNISIKSEKSIQGYSFVSQESELMKRKTQKVLQVVPEILAKDPRLKGAKWEYIKVVKELPSQKNVTVCRVNFSTLHAPVQITIYTDNNDKNIGYKVSECPATSNAIQGTPAGLTKVLAPTGAPAGSSLCSLPQGLFKPIAPKGLFKPIAPKGLFKPIAPKVTALSTVSSVGNDTSTFHTDPSMVEMKRPTFGPSTNQCFKCGRYFYSADEMKVHLISMHGISTSLPVSAEPKAPSTVLSSGNASGSNNGDTFSIHGGIANQPNQCAKCLKTFGSPSHMSKHVIPGHRGYVCQRCYRSFRHVSQCPKCKLSFADRAIVKFYLISIHGTSLFEACVQCFQKSDVFEEDSHNISKCITCCNLTFYSDETSGVSALKGHLQNHMYNRTAIPSVRLLQKFAMHKNVVNPTVNQNIVTRYSPLNQCPTCQRLFTSPSELQLHTSSKHDYTIHQCQICCQWSDKEGWLKAHSTVCAPQKKGNAPKEDHVQVPSHQVIPAASQPHTISKSGATVHQKVVNQTVITRYSPLNQCPTCRRSFPSPSELQLHTNSKHDYTIHQCQICCQWSDKEGWLKAHSAICVPQKENIQKKGKD